ncbi:hypothetical protein B0T20DRAFT_394489 [Sordaria brevicollis]|uniref:Uncharacterized protein n=1 Tax=Sordaria brevicollis TaxID=83679 RepID=A0AAE0UAV8_SORBR|nr:hypothetical protein B0T20DRAFT_394489 [Sordaria brevicollis]
MSVEIDLGRTMGSSSDQLENLKDVFTAERACGVGGGVGGGEGGGGGRGGERERLEERREKGNGREGEGHENPGRAHKWKSERGELKEQAENGAETLRPKARDWAPVDRSPSGPAWKPRNLKHPAAKFHQGRRWPHLIHGRPREILPSAAARLFTPIGGGAGYRLAVFSHPFLASPIRQTCAKVWNATEDTSVQMERRSFKEVVVFLHIRTRGPVPLTNERTNEASFLERSVPFALFFETAFARDWCAFPRLYLEKWGGVLQQQGTGLWNWCPWNSLGSSLSRWR